MTSHTTAPGSTAERNVIGGAAPRRERPVARIVLGTLLMVMAIG